MQHLDAHLQECIDHCLACHTVCLATASRHCLEVGGRHTEPEHFRLMLACAEICRTSAAFMALGLELHRRTCAVCAEVCEQCARSCEEVGDMDECVQACRRCAESCREMAA
ncbi:MAG TPA: four-helix bundle copper-binding protein [Geminicoccaceae bacterium]|nr:four-helix bundle copper-binding protein [Geminicoccaceae bacterium]